MRDVYRPTRVDLLVLRRIFELASKPITDPEWGSPTVRDLCEYSGRLSPATVQHQLQTLEGVGLVRLRGQRGVQLTERGEQTVRKARRRR